MKEQGIPYQLIRSKRKSVAIIVTEQGTVEVRVPMKISQKQIQLFVNQHRDWICQTVEKRKMAFQKKQQFTCQEGDTLPVLGREYPVKIGEQVCFTGQIFQLPKGNFLAVRPQIIQEYRRIAKQFIPKRVAEISAQIGLYPSAVKINSAKGRWGSCSGKHSLNFSWRLIWASPETVDYVIIHELCHIRHHNHSPDFWSLVASFLPNYRELRENLKQISRRLQEENWD